MLRGNQQTGGDADRFLRVIALVLDALGIETAALMEHRDQPRRDFQKAFVRIGAQRCQRLQPLVRREPLVELALLGFGAFADAPFQCSIGHRHETPWLLVGATGRGARCAQAVLDQFAWPGVAAKSRTVRRCDKSCANRAAASMRWASPIGTRDGKGMAACSGIDLLDSLDLDT